MASPAQLRTEVRRIPVDRLVHLDVNARFMTAEQQARLTANMQKDGAVTSAPLVWLQQNEGGAPLSDPETFLIVSGNHRVTSARAAGFAELDCIVILNWVPHARLVELQLAHNAVNGQDDLSVLERLYEDLDLSGKEYSGLTDDLFKGLKDLSLAGFGVGGPTYQEITLSFLPEDAEQFHDMVKRLEKAKGHDVIAGHIATWAGLFDTIVRVKEELNVQNNAAALFLMAELAIERLDQTRAEQPEEQKDQNHGTDINLVEPGQPDA